MIDFFRKLFFGKTIEEKIFDDEVKLNGFKAKYDSMLKICDARNNIMNCESDIIYDLAEKIGKLEKKLQLYKKQTSAIVIDVEFKEVK